MGKRGKKGGSRGGRGVRADYSAIVKQNEKYENYYNSLLNMPEEEKTQLWEALRRELPNSFRFTGSRRQVPPSRTALRDYSHALAVQQRLRDFYIPKITSITYEGKLVEPPRAVPWYPDQLAWSMTTPKNVVRRFAPFSAFQKFLVAETEIGNISRQEVVSMIPPLVLDVQPGMVVLDMCAAPGSKSAQLMEMVHAGEEERMAKIAQKLENDVEGAREAGTVNVPQLLNGEMELDGFDDDGRSTGLLIANDADYKRAHMLIHQMKRLNSPNLLVTNHDATMYPSIRLPPTTTPDGKVIQNRYLKFDRILADVPCSGDGTSRKNPNVWKDWNPANALGLHATQCRILARSLQMLKVGGRVVYSTCSMNPVENEAAVASVIDRCGGPSKVQIVDCSNELQGLIRSPGMQSWTVMDKRGRTWKSYKDVEEAIAGGDETLNRVVEGMFPPPEDSEEIDLSRCIRVYPHQQDTGGFFIAVLEKKGEIRAKPEGTRRDIPAAAVAPSSDINEQKKENGSKPATPHSTTEGQAAPLAPAASEDNSPANPMEASAPKRSVEEADEGPSVKRQKVADDTPTSEVATTSEQPAGAETKPEQDASQPKLLSKLPPKRKPGQPFEEPFTYLDPNIEEFDRIFKFYDISPQFPRDRFLVRNPEGRLAKTVYYTSALGRDILVENAGSGIKFVHGGIKMFVKQDVQSPEVCPWRIQTDGLKIIESWVGERVVTIHKKETLRKLLIEMFPKVNDDGWKELGEIGEWAKDLDMGCSILRIDPSEDENGFSERMVFPLWRSMYSLNLMLPKEDRRALLLRLFDDDTPIAGQPQKRKAAEPNNESNGQTTANVKGAEDSDILPSKAEEDAIKKENLVLGQEEQDAMSARESFNVVDEEADEMNTTV
ncbi:hypothetical protein AJ80_07626 [Polytolypa hystricis UAMH7299]|uniref:SAM-dependent MTase RsmB/NOP-type domain-containing protein n=1 Tax=Polytolypa hystricis (strain UAMH7299) TaxID=1447883 RepID=A0A2B7XE29_POLH7|nr:hypothetical protein AJ80_07626 [Polytolypa hystricis UAMH7299]